VSFITAQTRNPAPPKAGAPTCFCGKDKGWKAVAKYAYASGKHTPPTPFLDFIRFLLLGASAPSASAMKTRMLRPISLDERACVLEALLGFKRPGTDGVLT
jgi:hypothetical protein